MSVAIWSTLLFLASAIRNGRKSNDIIRVDQLITYGAPKPSEVSLENPIRVGGCFDGYRIINTNVLNVDAVATVPPFFDHPKMKTIKMNSKGDYWEWECGEKKLQFLRLNALLHNVGKYVKRVLWSDLPQHVKDVSVNGLNISYDETPEAVQSKLQPGWEVIGHSDVDNDFSYLVKNDAKCILTFSGTNNGLFEGDDWDTNLDTSLVSFCELRQQVHSGFKDEVMRYVRSDLFKANIKPKLGGCGHLTVTGHSLGGAVAAIFTACANNEELAENDADFKDLKWW